VELNPSGPVQLYDAPVMVDAFRFNVWPSHSGLLVVITGAAGNVLMLTCVLPADDMLHPVVTAVTLYSPALDILTVSSDGFCSDDANPFGPVQL